MSHPGELLRIAGGHLKISYKSNDTYTRNKRYYFPGIEGLINVYDGFYIPSDELTSMNISLHLDSEYMSFLTIGNTTVYRNNTYGEENIFLTDADLTDLDYSELVNKTIPVRFGLENVSFGLDRKVDVFSVTDLSGSMGTGCDYCSGSADETACPSSEPDCLGCPICEAKRANEDLIRIVLNNTGNKVGLVGYETQARARDFHELSGDNDSLVNHMYTTWDADGSTCICCGINKAVQEFNISYQKTLCKNCYYDKKGLVAYYKFEDDALDSTDNDNDGSTSGNPSYVSGLNGQAISMDGSDHVELPDIITSQNGSISMWINPGYDRYQTIFDASTSSRYFFIDIDNGRDLRFAFEDSDNAAFYDADRDVAGIDDTGWHHVVAIWRYEESPATQLYLDGNLWDSDNDVPGKIADFLTPYVGETRSNYVSPWDYQGQIDELRIYDRVLDSSEILGLNNTSPSCGNSVVEVGELCDDGDYIYCESGGAYGRRLCNLTSCESFEETCDTSYDSCGDGWKNSSEECDDGNNDNLDGCDENCTLETRYWSMIVMSDGEANVGCAEQPNSTAQADAIQAACDAYNQFGIEVHAVGFSTGGSVDETTLQGIANCGRGIYNQSGVGNLEDIYREIADRILKAAYTEQTILAEGGDPTMLYPDSYIEFGYPEVEVPNGLVLTLENRFEDNYTGNFTLPDNSTILEAVALSYSGPRWTDKVDINNITIFNLSDYKLPYIKLGDPYAVNIPLNYVNQTERNNVNLTTALGPSNTSQGSEYNKIVYKILKEMIAYSEISAFADGCIWDIEFEDESNITVVIPTNYSESDRCYYNESRQSVTDTNDAMQTSVLNLLEQMDIDHDGKIDFKFTDQNFQITASQINGIPYSYWTEVEIRKWT